MGATSGCVRAALDSLARAQAVAQEEGKSGEGFWVGAGGSGRGLQRARRARVRAFATSQYGRVVGGVEFEKRWEGRPKGRGAVSFGECTRRRWRPGRPRIRPNHPPKSSKSSCEPSGRAQPGRRATRVKCG